MWKQSSSISVSLSNSIEFQAPKIISRNKWCESSRKRMNDGRKSSASNNARCTASKADLGMWLVENGLWFSLRFEMNKGNERSTVGAIHLFFFLAYAPDGKNTLKSRLESKLYWLDSGDDRFVSLLRAQHQFTRSKVHILILKLNWKLIIRSEKTNINTTTEHRSSAFKDVNWHFPSFSWSQFDSSLLRVNVNLFVLLPAMVCDSKIKSKICFRLETR